jgi:hypothetical protein
MRTVRMEVTAIQTKYARRSYFYCVGSPQYQNLMEQAKESRLVSMGLSSLLPCEIMIEKKKLAITIIDKCLALRLQPGPQNMQVAAIQQQQQQQQQPPINDEQVEAVAAAVTAAVDYAAALDLNRRPRLSRTNIGTSLTVVGDDAY